MSDDASTPLERLLDLLVLEPLDRDLFLSRVPHGEGRLFGGLVAAQSVVAADNTVDPDAGRLHSLHAYFLRPGDPRRPIHYEVDRIRDGRSFGTRRVVALQDDVAIFNMAASFHSEEHSFEHQASTPALGEPGGELYEDVIHREASRHREIERDDRRFALGKRMKEAEPYD